MTSNSHSVLHFFSLHAADIYDKVQEELAKNGLDTECLGGGRILHEPDKGSISVFGYSQVSTFFARTHNWPQLSYLLSLHFAFTADPAQS